jgi:DNA polymerase-3 subunit delta'
LSARLEHPDINWFFPLPRPKRAAGAKQLRQKLEYLRADALEERRANLLYLDEEEGATGIYVGAVHTMRSLAQSSPAMGPAKVLIIGRAEALTPQLGSPEAANALLKLLEEPPADTTLILTSDVPGALLPTVRSRVQAMRIAPLPDERIASFLATRADIEEAEARRLASRSGGSIGRALELRDQEQENLRESAGALVRALLDGRPSAQLAAAHRFRSFGARGAFGRLLGEARSMLRDLLAVTAGAAASDPEGVATLAGDPPADLTRIIQLLDALDEARELAERNVNPQLIVANLTRLGSGRPAGSFTPRAGHGGA